MKLMHLTILFVCSLIILIVAKPLNGNKQSEEVPYEVEQIDGRTFHLKLDIDRPQDREVADIIWFQEAANLAIDQEIPRFNVREQKITNEYVEGIIQLEPDAMKAEYDAHEILSLELSEEEK